MAKPTKTQNPSTCKPLTAARLRERLHYDPETGIFTNRIWRASNAVAGAVSGRVRPDGYHFINIDGKQHASHRLAWLYMTGEWLVNFIDHKDMNKSNNRWSNLREASGSQNMHNRPKMSNNTSGYKGVYWCNQRMKWKSSIKKDYKFYHLGFFKESYDAHLAYAAASKRLLGEFSRVD